MPELYPCQACGTHRALRLDGTHRMHKDHAAKRPCPGSLQTPEASADYSIYQLVKNLRTVLRDAELFGLDTIPIAVVRAVLDARPL